MTTSTTHVIAVITMEVSVSGPWGENATIGQMTRDAKRAADNIIQQMVKSNVNRIRTIGATTFKTVTHEPKE